MKLSKEDMYAVNRVTEKHVIQVNTESIRLLKSIFTSSVLSAVIRDYSKIAIDSLPLKVEEFLLNYISTTYAEEYQKRLRDEILLEGTQTKKITSEEMEKIEKLASKKYERHVEYGTIDATLFYKINARPNIKYDLPDTTDFCLTSSKGQFLKIKNRIYYVLGEKQPDPRTNNLAYDFTDLPFALFVAYVVLSYMVEVEVEVDVGFLEENTTSRSIRSNLFVWRRVFCFLLDPRLQKECFKLLKINKVCKIDILVAWMTVLEYSFKDKGDCIISPFQGIYSESSDKTETYLERDTVCNLLEFLGVDLVEAASLGEQSTSYEGLKEMLLSLARFLESQTSLLLEQRLSFASQLELVLSVAEQAHEQNRA